MKSFLIVLALGFGIARSAQNDSLARVAAHIINEERRRIGVDTLEYEADTFCFATDWADSTNRFFHNEGNAFSRKAAHRNCKNRMIGYEKVRGKEWKHFAECLATGGISKDEDNDLVIDYTKALLNSKDHYKVLMNDGYKRILVGISIQDNFYSMVVFTTSEYK